MKRAVVLAAILAMGASGALAASAAEAIKARQQGMKQVGATFKALRDGVMGGDSAAELKPYAARLVELAEASGGWFPAGSGPGAGVETEAKAAIWTEKARFQAADETLVLRARALKAAIEAGEPGAMRAALGQVGGACKGCHDQFRED